MLNLMKYWISLPCFPCHCHFHPDYFPPLVSPLFSFFGLMLVNPDKLIIDLNFRLWFIECRTWFLGGLMRHVAPYWARHYDRISVRVSQILSIWKIWPQQNVYINNIYNLLQTDFDFTRSWGCQYFTLPHMFRRTPPDSAGLCWILPDLIGLQPCINNTYKNELHN